MLYFPSIGSLCSPILSQGIPTLGLQSGSLLSSIYINPDPNIPNQHGPRPNIFNRRRSRENNTFLLLQLYTPAPKLTPTNVGLIQPTSGIPQSLLGLSHLHFQTPRLPPTFPNRHRVRLNYLQPTPWLPETLSTNAMSFEPSITDIPGQSEILTPGLPPTC